MTADGAPLSLLEACKINAMSGGLRSEFKKKKKTSLSFFSFTNVLCFVASSPSPAVCSSSATVTRHLLVCSEASFFVHCFPINVSIFVQLYMECKPVKPLARPQSQLPFQFSRFNAASATCFCDKYFIFIGCPDAIASEFCSASQIGWWWGEAFHWFEFDQFVRVGQTVWN